MNKDTCFIERPWGRYITTMTLPGIATKMLFIDPWKRTSLQSHKHRDEYWTVAKGTALVELDGILDHDPPISKSIISLKPGGTLFIPRDCRHRVKNVAGNELIISELWLGDELSEDDITRYEDDFGRVNID